MTEIQNTDNTNAYKDVEQPKPSFFAGGMQNGTATLDSSLAISYKANHGLTIWSRNHTPSYLPNRIKNSVHTKTYPWMFISALFIIVKKW